MSGARDAASGSRFIILLSLIALTVATPVDELSGSELLGLGAGGTRVVGDSPLEVMVVCAPGPMTNDGRLPTGSEMVRSPTRAVGGGIAPRDMPR